MFPSFDFKRVDEDREAWYIHTLYKKDRNNILNKIEGLEGKERGQKALDEILPIMKENWFERRANLANEDKIQERLLPDLKEQLKIFEKLFGQYKNIAVVSHGECIKRYAGYKIKNC